MFFDVYRELCESLNKTPNGVAREIGIASPSVTQWKNGSVPRAKTIQQIADYFGVSTSVFFQDGPESSFSDCQGQSEKNLVTVGYQQKSPSTEADGRRAEVMRLWDALDDQTQEHFFALLQAAAKQ